MASSENSRLCLTSLNESELVLPPQSHSASSPVSKPKGVSFCGWRHASKDFMSWAHKLSKMHQHTWRKAGIYEAIMASTKKIHKDLSLILAIAEKWCPKTNSFIFSWGEATITLEDVMVLLGFSVSGLPYFASLESPEEKRTKEKLDDVCVQIKMEKGFRANQVTWVSRFMDTGDELEHVAFLALWLSYFVFPSRYYHVDEAFFPIAVHLSSGRRIAIAPAVLSHLYAELRFLRKHIQASNESTIPLEIDLSALFKLVQVWTWERFKELQPPIKPMLKGDPRLALWHDLKKKASNAKQILENSTMDSFEWRPYTTPVENWNFPQFYPEKAMWVPVDNTNIDDEFISFARCIRVSKLVGIDCVEPYFPNRVASQFGMVQDVTCPGNRNHLSLEEAWKHYNKPIDDLVLYIPSRFRTPQETPRLYTSIENGVVESAETLTAGGDGTGFVHLGSEMSGASKDGMNISEESKSKKRAREDDGSSMVRVQTHVPSDNDEEEADRLTIAQRVKRRYNKCSGVKRSGGDASEPLGKRSILEADANKNSGPCQYLASVRDETLPLPEIEQMNDEADETGSNAGRSLVLSVSDENNFSSPLVGFDGATDIVVSPPETMQNCDDELDVHGSNADENTMINDRSKEPDCLLREDGVIAGDCGDETVPEKMQTNEDTTECGSEADEISVPIPSDENNSTDPPLASEGANEDERSKAHKSMGLSSSDKSNTHVDVGDQTHGQDCLPRDNGLGSEETMKSKEQLEDLGKRNDEDFANDPVKQILLNMKEMAKDMEEGIMKTQNKMAQWKAMIVMKVASARLV